MKSMGNILLVDDEEAFLSTMTKRLTKRDYNVSTATSGKDALALLGEKNDVEVVILDVKMPGLDGIETLVEIKKKFPKFKKMPVLYFTQLLALALDLDESALRFDLNWADPARVLQKVGSESED